MHSRCQWHYKSHLIDGTILSERYIKGTPSTFHPNNVPPGWDEVLLAMREGDLFEIYIPLGGIYDDDHPLRLDGKPVSQDDTLIMELKLLKVDTPLNDEL